MTKHNIKKIKVSPPPTTPNSDTTTPVSGSNRLETGAIPPMIPNEVIQQLNEQIVKKLKQASESKKKNEKRIEDFKPLELIVSEYLKSFLILGYTLDGNKILIGHSPTPQDHDALVEHLRQTFMRTVNEM